MKCRNMASSSTTWDERAAQAVRRMGWQMDWKHMLGALVGTRSHEATGMCLDNTLADRQTKPESIRLGGEERLLEQACHLRIVEAATVVANTDRAPAVARRISVDTLRGRWRLHRIPRVLKRSSSTRCSCRIAPPIRVVGGRSLTILESRAGASMPQKSATASSTSSSGAQSRRIATRFLVLRPFNDAAGLPGFTGDVATRPGQ